jgi:hypothetical protein
VSEALALVQQDAAQAMMPVLRVEQAAERYRSVVKFVQTLMNEGSDFGKIPGTDKPTLLKPGAEKLTTFFGLSKRFHLAEKIEDWSGADHNGEPFFYYVYRCSLFNGDWLIAESDGSCNSFESKYRYRKAERTCPSCGAAAIIKGKAEYGGGWLCFAKKGGCGGKFPDGSAEIEGQHVGRIPNPDVCDLVNTIQKMAQKRAFIAATLLAVNASEFFTQDVEDLVVAEEPVGAQPTAPTVATERRPSTSQPPRPAAQPAAAPAQSNGKSAEEQSLDARLLEHCKKEKGEKLGPAFFNGVYAKKSLEEKRAAVSGLPSNGAPVPADEVIEGEIVEPPKAANGAGLDQWQCTLDTNSRVLALQILQATRRLEKTGVSETEWRAALNDVPGYDLPVSRKALTAEDADEWLKSLNRWAEKNEKAKGATA